MQVYSLISSLKTYYHDHPTLHLTPWSLDLFIHVPFQLHGEHTVLQPFRRIELIVHIAISVLPGSLLIFTWVKWSIWGSIIWCPTQVGIHKVIVIWFWVGLPRGVIPSIDMLYISDPKVVARLSQCHKNQNGRPKMLNGQQTTETAIILEYFVS